MHKAWIEMKRVEMNRLVHKTQTWHGDKSRTNLEYGVAIVKLEGSYAETIFTVSAHNTKLSGDQEDKLDWKRKGVQYCIPEWGPRGQVGSTQDTTGSLIYYWL
jgi:hypothetical protein